MSRGDTPGQALFVPGRNAWAVEQATRFAVLQDGEIYFRLLRDAILRAERTVFVLSWDINAGTDLTPKKQVDRVPSRLGDLIRYAARRKPGMQCFLLTWDYGLLFALERDPFTRWRLGWNMPRNVRLGFDDHHPIGACHHQKVVVVDDTLAFSGSIDPTGHRWDTTSHLVGDPARLDPLGQPYDPYHEVQAMMDGPAAARLGALVRDRWRDVGVTDLPPPAAPRTGLWPAEVVPDFADVDVAIARTIPGTASTPGVRECETLYFDAIARARRTIYIENQYFTHPGLADALAARLAEPDGPEVVIVVPRGGEGWLDRNSIQIMRNELFQKLTAADEHHRLRLLHPMASRQRGTSTFIHSKVLIVDDELVLVGSANTNRRSMGMDTECDVAVAPRDAAGRAKVTAVRTRLVGEHLGITDAGVLARLAAQPSLCDLLDTSRDSDHTLVRFTSSDIVTAPLDDALRYAVDPDGPPAIGDDVAWMVPVAEGAGPRTPLRIWMSPVVALVAAGVVAWGPLRNVLRPDEVSTIGGIVDATRTVASPGAVAVILATAAAMSLLPLEPLLVAIGMIFGGWRGVLIAASATIMSAVVGYAVGRWLGSSRATRWVSTRSERSIRRLAVKGVRGIAVLRLAGLASTGAVHVVSGSARVPFGSFLAGTAIGLLPASMALTALGALLGRTVTQPSVENALATAAAALVVLAAALGLRAFLLLRQFTPAATRHGREFG